GHAFELALGQIVGSVGRGPRDAAIALHGLRPVVVPGRVGISIDRSAARREILDRFAQLSRDPVVLPLSPQPPQVTAATLSGRLAQVGTAVSLPVDLALGSTRSRIPRWQLSSLLRPPSRRSPSLQLRRNPDHPVL